MRLSSRRLLGRLIPSIFLFLHISGCAVIGTYEEITIHGATEDLAIHAKIDSGAKRSSIDEKIASALGLPILDETVYVKSANGVRERHLVEIKFTLAGETIKTRATVADRSHLAFPIIIGVIDLTGRFLIKPEVFEPEEEAEEEN